MKTCTGPCGQTLPLDAFYKQPAGRYGREGQCKECRKVTQRAWATSAAGRVSMSRRNARYGKTPRGRHAKRDAAVRYGATPKGRAADRRRREHAPEKIRARLAVKAALRAGTLTRPTRCEKCNKPRKVHAHHDDYNRLLDVKWWCRKCHDGHHAEET